MGEPAVGEVPDERFGELAVVGERSVAVAPLPRSQVHLVDRDRRVERVAVGALRHPTVVVPVVVEVGDDRRVSGRELAGERERVGLLPARAGFAHDEVLVAVTDRGGVGETGEDTSAVDGSELVRLVVPIVEVAHDRHAAGVGRPHREVDAVSRGVRAQEAVGPTVGAFGEIVQIGVAHHAHAALRKYALITFMLRSAS